MRWDENIVNVGTALRIIAAVTLEQTRVKDFRVNADEESCRATKEDQTIANLERAATSAPQKNAAAIRWQWDVSNKASSNYNIALRRDK